MNSYLKEFSIFTKNLDFFLADKGGHFGRNHQNDNLKEQENDATSALQKIWLFIVLNTPLVIGTPYRYILDVLHPFSLFQQQGPKNVLINQRSFPVPLFLKRRRPNTTATGTGCLRHWPAEGPRLCWWSALCLRSTTMTLTNRHSLPLWQRKRQPPEWYARCVFDDDFKCVYLWCEGITEQRMFFFLNLIKHPIFLCQHCKH
jgi:hypothetical protein